eukprot:tig00020825_g14298.t1
MFLALLLRSLPQRRACAGLPVPIGTAAFVRSRPPAPQWQGPSLLVALSRKARVKPSFYAVRAGRRPGVYSTWAECEEQVRHFKGARFKKFSSQADADAFCRGELEPGPRTRTRRTAPKQGEAPVRSSIVSEREMLDPHKHGTCVLFADGACKGKRDGCRAGGWGCVVVRRPPEGAAGGPVLVERSGHDPDTTNNRMELRAVISAMELLPEHPPHNVHVFVDSKYVRDGITDWIKKWKRADWMRNKDEPVLNRGLWEALDEAVEGARAAGHALHWHWVKGHAGHVGNERADALASDAAVSGEGVDRRLSGDDVPRELSHPAEVDRMGRGLEEEEEEVEEDFAELGLGTGAGADGDPDDGGGGEPEPVRTGPARASRIPRTHAPV